MYPGTRTLIHFLAALSLIGTPFLAGCGPDLLLPEQDIRNLRFREERANSIIYFNERWDLTSPGRVTVRTHWILRVGDNPRDVPDQLSLYDGSIERLTGFQAKVRLAAGGSHTYGMGDLTTSALSNANVIREARLRHLPIEGGLDRGDLVESVETQELALGPLGAMFSLDEVGNSAYNVSCTFVVGASDTLWYQVVSDTVRPVITMNEGHKLYTFSWHQFVRPASQNPFRELNPLPGILAAVPVPGHQGEPTWQAFGDWFLSLVTPELRCDDAMLAVARNVTGGKTTDREKMDAIFQYVQKEVRYEQVYLERGEFIPNDAPLIFARKYGDCKDYSSLMYAMAAAVGLHPNLALCYRGRGVRFHRAPPVAQFNHMILYLNDAGRDCWYDATNRSGIPGLTTPDLINATALVLDRDASRLKTIRESPDNLLAITGALGSQGDGLAGTLSIRLVSQPAIPMLLARTYLNEANMRRYLISWLQRTFHPAMIVRDLDWSQDSAGFTITTACEIPNCVTSIQNYSYVSPARLFPSLLPPPEKLGQDTNMFYLPYTDRVSITLALRGFAAASSPGSPYTLSADYALPPGPYAADEQGKAREALESAVARFNLVTKLVYERHP